MSNILLSKGLSWKIGNEESVDIWGDRWSLSLLVGHAAGTGVTKVSDLIDTTMGCWDDAVIAWNFDSLNAALTKQVPLNNVLSRDQVWWIPMKTGLFTVRSAYGLEVQEGYGALVAEWFEARHFWSFWKHLWQCKVPGKAKHLVWRACNNILPTRSKLFCRRFASDSKCPVYQQEGGMSLMLCGLAPMPVMSGLWLRNGLKNLRLRRRTSVA
ncbi:hypothetical protein FCV25MIE_33825 [Fagus crenata]